MTAKSISMNEMALQQQNGGEPYFPDRWIIRDPGKQPCLYSRLVLEILPKLSLECLRELISPMIQWLQFAKEEAQHLGLLHEA